MSRARGGGRALQEQGLTMEGLLYVCCSPRLEQALVLVCLLLRPICRRGRGAFGWFEGLLQQIFPPRTQDNFPSASTGRANSKRVFIVNSIYNITIINIHIIVISLSLYIYIYIHMYIFIYISISVSLYLYISISLYLSLYIHIYIYIYISLSLYVNTHNNNNYNNNDNNNNQKSRQGVFVLRILGQTAGGRAVVYEPMKSEPPTPTRAPDNQLRTKSYQTHHIYRNIHLLNLLGWGWGFLFHR